MNSHSKVFSNQINIYNPHLLYYYITYFFKNRIWVHYEIVDDFECIVIVCTRAFYPYILNQNTQYELHKILAIVSQDKMLST